MILLIVGAVVLTSWSDLQVTKKLMVVESSVSKLVFNCGLILWKYLGSGRCLSGLYLELGVNAALFICNAVS